MDDELKIYYVAFKNYLWVKVLDDVFAIIKSHCIFICLCFKMVSFKGEKKVWAMLKLVSFRILIQSF